MSSKTRSILVTSHVITCLRPVSIFNRTRGRIFCYNNEVSSKPIANAAGAYRRGCWKLQQPQRRNTEPNSNLLPSPTITSLCFRSQQQSCYCFILLRIPHLIYPSYLHNQSVCSYQYTAQFTVNIPVPSLSCWERHVWYALSHCCWSKVYRRPCLRRKLYYTTCYYTFRYCVQHPPSAISTHTVRVRPSNDILLLYA